MPCKDCKKLAQRIYMDYIGLPACDEDAEALENATIEQAVAFLEKELLDATSKRSYS